MTTNSKKSKNTKASKSTAKTTKVTTEKTVKAAAPAVTAPVQAAPVATPAKVELKTTTKAPVAKTETLVKTEAVKVETTKTLAPAKTDTVVKTVSRGELEQLVRREAFKRAQLRQFRGGSPVNDWFAAEAAVKAQLTARGFALN